MKILIPILGFGRTGGYRVLSELANKWLKNGHEVDFLANKASALPYFPTNAGIIWVENSGKQVEKNDPAIVSPSIFNVPNNLKSLYRSLSKIGKCYDIIFANHCLTVWPTAFANCGFAKKYYYIQAYEPEYYAMEKGVKSKLLELMAIQSYRFKITQICNAPIYIGYKNVKAETWIPPGIDFDIFYPKTSCTKIKEFNEIILGCIGRKEPGKGIKYAIEAFAELYESDRRYRFHVAFGNLPENWTHPGLRVVHPKNDAELGEFYRGLDIMLAPGTVQLGAPHYPVMEAMACGIPVITTGYLPASEANSWIVPTHCTKAIVIEVQNIILDAHDRKKEKLDHAIESIKSFSWENTSDMFIESFNKSILKNPAACLG
jgi:glycosyltransferase involved in cell wall biosynthesis